MNRYCIIATPRTGSHYLEDLIFRKLPKSKENPSIKLGEFFHDEWVSYTDSDGNIRHEILHINTPERFQYTKEIRENIKNNKNQSYVLRIFFLPFLIKNNQIKLEEIIDFLIFLKRENFVFINLTRDIFEKTISLVVSEKTKKWHTLEDSKNIDETKFPILISDWHFKDKYFYLKQQEELTNEVLTLLNFPIINVHYDSLIEDCIKNQILISDFSVYKKTYERPYSSLIVNYNHLCDLFACISRIKNG